MMGRMTAKSNSQGAPHLAARVKSPHGWATGMARTRAATSREKMKSTMEQFSH